MGRHVLVARSCLLLLLRAQMRSMLWTAVATTRRTGRTRLRIRGLAFGRFVLVCRPPMCVCVSVCGGCNMTARHVRFFVCSGSSVAPMPAPATSRAVGGDVLHPMLLSSWSPERGLSDTHTGTRRSLRRCAKSTRHGAASKAARVRGALGGWPSLSLAERCPQRVRAAHGEGTRESGQQGIGWWRI